MSCTTILGIEEGEAVWSIMRHQRLLALRVGLSPLSPGECYDSLYRITPWSFHFMWRCVPTAVRTEPQKWGHEYKTRLIFFWRNEVIKTWRRQWQLWMVSECCHSASLLRLVLLLGLLHCVSVGSDADVSKICWHDAETDEQHQQLVDLQTICI
jgi:hypothetical protein